MANAGTSLHHSPLIFVDIILGSLMKGTQCSSIINGIPSYFGCNPESLGLVRRQSTDHDVIPVPVSQCTLHRSRGRIHVRVFLEPVNESACPGQHRVEIVDTEKQEQAVARLPLIGARQGGMIMRTPLVK